MSHDTQNHPRTNAELFHVLSQVATALMSEWDEQRLLQLIARTACELTGATFAALSLRSVDEEGRPQGPAEGSLFHLAAVIGITPEQEALFRRIPLGGEGLLAPIFRHGVPVLVADALAHLPAASDAPASHLLDAKAAAHEAAFAFAYGWLPERELPSPGIAGGHPLVRSFLGAPLLDRTGEVRGGLLMGHADPNQFTQEDQTILVSLAGQAAVALENVRLYQQAQVRALELQATFDSISDGVILLDRQGKVQQENAAAHKVRRTVLECPQAEPLLEALLTAPAQSVLSGSEVQERVVQVSDAHGEQRDYLVTAQPLRPATMPLGLLSQHPSSRSPDEEPFLSRAVVIWHDVTERRLRQVAQERTSYLEATFEAMVDGVYVYDQQAGIMQMNSAAHTMLARVEAPGSQTLPLDERISETIAIGVEGQRLSPQQWPVIRMLQGEQFTPEHTFEMQIPTHDGGVLYTSVTGGPIRDDGGQIIGAVAISRDVTEGKQAEQVLQKAQRQAQEYAAQLEAILEAMPDILLVYDSAGRIIRTNAAGGRFLERFRLSGVTSVSIEEPGTQSIIYTEQGAVLPPEAWPTSRILRGETLTPDNTVDLMQRDPQGNELFVSTTGGPLYDAQGRCRGGVFLAHDITERKQAERQREQQAQQLRLQSNLIELAHDAIIVCDLHSVILSWNQGAEALYGWSAQEAKGQVTQNLLQTQFPHSMELVERLLEQEGRWEGELVQTCRDESTVIVESRWVLLRDAADQPSAILEINRDATAQRHLEQLERSARAEARSRLTLLQMVLDELPSGIYLVRGPEARLVLANRAAATNFGARWAPGQPLQEFLTRHHIRILRPDGRPLDLAQLPALRVVQQGESVRHFQQVIRHADETTLPVLVNAVLLDAASLPGGRKQSTSDLDEPERAALVVYQDVTSLKEAEALKDEFLSIATHELRSPLTVLKAYADLLLRQASTGKGGALTARQQELLQGIAQAATKLTKLAEDLLDVTRLQSEQFSLPSELTDLVAIIERVVEQQQVTTEHHHLLFHSLHAHLLVNIDPGRLEQVLTNLLSNAIKYSPQGGRIEVTLVAQEETEEAVLSICDHGMGIPAEQQARIFGRFVRAHNARASGIVGTGLGLYLCRQLIEHYGGRIWFESSEGVGSTFFVALPILAQAQV